MTVVGGAGPEWKVRMAAPLPPQSPNPDTTAPLSLLDRQVEICIELERHSAALLERLGAGQLNDAVAFMAQRKPLIDRLCAVNSQFATRCPSWAAYLSTLPPAERHRAVTLAARHADLLTRVRSMDTLLSERLVEAKAEISRSLSGLQNQRHSNRAYVTGSSAPIAPGRNQFMDRRG